MNKNITAIILIVLAIGTYFTFTSGRIDELKAIQAVNLEYKKALASADNLFKERDRVIQDDIKISQADNERLNKLLPNNVDHVRLIIDVKDNIAKRHGLFLKGIKTESPENIENNNQSQAGGAGVLPSDYGTVTLSFSVTSSYNTMLDFLKDLEASLRVMDISKLGVTAGDDGLYDFNVEIKTYWLRQ